MVIHPKHRYQIGISMVEILMTLVVVTFGLLALAALQGKAHSAQLEAYQRAQALILLQDMVSRIEGNRAAAASYATSTDVLGTGHTALDDCTTASDRAAQDKCEWSKALKGASEISDDKNRGAMIDGRGCIEELAAGSRYQVSVVWQGLSELKEPDTTTCGSGAYTSRWRRAVTTLVVIPDLSS
mgnify:CR=1 FL=1